MRSMAVLFSCALFLLMRSSAADEANLTRTLPQMPDFTDFLMWYFEKGMNKTQDLRRQGSFFPAPIPGYPGSSEFPSVVGGFPGPAPFAPTGQGSGDAMAVTSRGPVVGKRYVSAIGVAMHAFLSVPYAERPNRLEIPRIKEKWSGSLDARQAGPACAVAGPQGTLSPGSSEDCLFMKILVPVTVDPNVPLPVLFWPHGGGFAGGSANDYDLDAQAENLVGSKNVILAQPTYRVGPFGFFTTQSPEAPGNYASWDVYRALEFVRQEIAAFGGDPERITLVGQGAGAVQSSLLTLSPLSRGMYRAAAMFSGSMLMPQVAERPEEVRRKMAGFAMAAGCDDGSWEPSRFAQVVNCLRLADADSLLRASIDSGMDASLMWHPTVDGPGGLLPLPVEQLAKSRDPLPTVMGDTAMETAWDLFVLPSIRPSFLNPGAYQLQIPANFAQLNSMRTVLDQCDTLLTTANFADPSRARSLCKTFFASQPAFVTDPGYWLKQAVAVGSSFRYHAPVQRDLRFHLLNGNQAVYRYSFDYVRNQGYPSNWWTTAGSFHNLDLAFLERFFPADAYRFVNDEQDQVVTDTLINAIVAFAYTGSPATAEAPWAPLLPVGQPEALLSVDCPPRMKLNEHSAEESLWNCCSPFFSSKMTVAAGGSCCPRPSNGIMLQKRRKQARAAARILA